MTCPESLTVVVTEQDYMLGDPEVSSDHPMSLAVGRILEGASEIVTMPGVIIIKGLEERDVWYTLPEVGKQFYDTCEKGDWDAKAPIAFTMERWHRTERKGETYVAGGCRWTA